MKAVNLIRGVLRSILREGTSRTRGYGRNKTFNTPGWAARTKAAAASASG
jgi:hypothetical protein